MPDPIKDKLPVPAPSNPGKEISGGGLVSFHMDIINGEVFFVLKNHGNITAKNVLLWFDQWIPVVLPRTSFKYWNLSSMATFPLGTLTPGEEIRCFTGILPQWLQNGNVPRNFLAMVSWVGLNAERNFERFPQDIRWYNNWVERY